jgi:hypothetical protein
MGRTETMDEAENQNGKEAHDLANENLQDSMENDPGFA